MNPTARQTAMTAAAPQVGTLVVFKSEYCTRGMLCRVVRVIEQNEMVTLQVTGLDTKAPMWGETFIARYDQLDRSC